MFLTLVTVILFLPKISCGSLTKNRLAVSENQETEGWFPNGKKVEHMFKFRYDLFSFLSTITDFMLLPINNHSFFFFCQVNGSFLV